LWSNLTDTAPERAEMKNSYDQCLDELAAYGLAPRARQQPARRVAGARRDRQGATLMAQASGNTPSGRQFAKALSELDATYRAQCLRPVIVDRRALAESPRPEETISKAFHALQHDPGLSAAERGSLMLGLARLTDHVEFAKAAHPMIGNIDEIRTKLDRALAEGHAGNAEPIIREALKLIANGGIAPQDHARLSLLLGEIRSKLSEVSDAQG
jgi:hypothetical protein